MVTVSSLSAVTALPVAQQILCIFLPYWYFVKNSTYFTKILGESPCKQGWSLRRSQFQPVEHFLSLLFLRL